MRTRVKICGITNKEDLAAACLAGADAVGFVFYPPSPRAITIEQLLGFIETIPAFVTKVGLFVNESPEVVKETARVLKLDLLQFHGDESADYCQQFNQSYIKAVRVKPGLNLIQYAKEFKNASGLLLDAFVPGIPGGTGEKFDWDLIPTNLDLPVILAGGLDDLNVAEAIQKVKPWAVDVSGGVERQKGLKDHQKIFAFVNAVNQA
ncbi:phosphoribosylanthranilate isomerase [Leeia sp. TBRC 13508]|uniref:N-(5'-phosphoribosyl)anthranilate isomerase n=1 Tax=Leeia speluncae TaxID=2884804 RepID=A0ABS8DC83_9NEIS|nr:phosphoribosylanthranilate isomerase [Leeia speluncae]MCB6185253.1 phosphoribosylanthranilate isomerase [Leeia speluncae]